MTSRSRRQVYTRRNESSGVAAPSPATTDGALEAAADHMRVSIKHEASTSSKDVLECSATDADLQNTAVKSTFKVEIMAEGQLSGVALDGNAWRIEALVTDRIGIVDERGIRQRISRREGISII